MPAPNYLRSSEIVREACQKPQRGSYVLEKEKADAEQDAKDVVQKKAAKSRDRICRWPERHKCRGGLEAAHIKDASLGGACVRANLVTLCKWIHRSGPESLHGKQLKIEMESADGADGGLSFWRFRDDLPTRFHRWYLVRREVRPFEYERD
jgi:hypothetical protein